MLSFLALQLVSFSLGIASNLTSEQILKAIKEKVSEELAKTSVSQARYDTGKPISDQFEDLAANLAQFRDFYGTDADRQVFALLADPTFREDLSSWLMRIGMEDVAEQRSRVMLRIASALRKAHVKEVSIGSFQERYETELNNFILQNPVLSSYLHGQMLRHVRETADETLAHVRHEAGVYSEAEKRKLLERYCEVALRRYDIVDLDALPGQDL